MTTVTLTEIRKNVQAAGGEYKKERFQLNGQPAYRANGRIMTKADMIESYRLGVL